MKVISQSYRVTNQIIALILAMHFINLSVDPKDRNPDYISEDLSINDIESITEFIAEVVFGWEDAFSEHDEADNEDGRSIDFYNFLPSYTGVTLTTSNTNSLNIENFIIRNSILIKSLSQEINSPPPRG